MVSCDTSTDGPACDAERAGALCTEACAETAEKLHTAVASWCGGTFAAFPGEKVELIGSWRSASSAGEYNADSCELDSAVEAAGLATAADEVVSGTLVSLAASEVAPAVGSGLSAFVLVFRILLRGLGTSSL